MTTDINGVRYFFVDAGKGLPVLFIHGFPFSHAIWQPQIEALAKHFRIIAPDLRGHGESAASSGVYTMDAFAEDLRALIDVCNCGPVVLAGHSMGGYIAFAFYRKFPQQVRALILVCTRASADSEEGKAGRERLAQRVEREGAPAVVEQMLPKMLAAATVASRPDLVDHVRNMMLGTSVSGLAGSLRGMAVRPSSLELLPHLAAPTLVISGSEDLLIPTQEAETMAKTIPGAQLQLIPHAGHLASLENPSDVTAAIRDFLVTISHS
ncbi:MAG: alpha/beta fold hydrolase [candidate division KSB1 bacterium]|nr:alpha/beta fold hydrolase [candidate division KSB1 bacterium]MDZ7300859.1 alpha/beta fold hydrolase [candidate division KSB1 bacterium]MDZ7309871.1 alpha/beta fold hydrolase [candidate division KSB1 bacterium]